MTDITDRIMSEIESDPRIDAKEISLDAAAHGFLRRRRVLTVNGMVGSTEEKSRVLEIVTKQADDEFDIEDQLVLLDK